MDALIKTLFQTFAKSQSANKMARKYGLRFGASRFVAGETIEGAIDAVRSLNASGREATLDHLGEFVATEAEASLSAMMCLKTLDAIASSGVKANLSLKLTSLGLGISEEVCLSNLTAILNRARMYGLFVRIDMEDFAQCEKTIAIYKRLREQIDNVGIVIQAYLYRSIHDLEELKDLKPNLRLVKGAYKESPKVAIPAKPDVDDNYKRLIATHLKNGGYAAIATHDSGIIDYAKQIIHELNIPNERFEFQMLYGIREDLQLQLVREGYKVRVYVPFGSDWFGYFMRRLAERPANVWFVVKNFFK
ncbi:proline dehydrogenase family protein [Paenibacillus macerans]|uniref:proline dehydrogenase family protein n=1 Tax=Paenibacillus macerans TaxID=44252 RepID=UPI003D312C1D